MHHPLRKRLFDLALTIPALVLLAPVLLVVALLVRCKLGTPIFFRQERPGLGGKAFLLLKFRTMTDSRGADGGLLSDAQRMTPFGRLLRRSSLDELPELLNVLKGEMSLVGPRPLLMEYLPRYSPEQARRHDALPGLTGLAQVSGRNNLSWEDKFALDVEYVEKSSLWLDMKILLMTVRAVVGAEGVSAPSHATAPEFMGSVPGAGHGKEAA